MESSQSHFAHLSQDADNRSKLHVCHESVLCLLLLTASAIAFSFVAVAASWAIFADGFKLIRVF